MSLSMEPGARSITVKIRTVLILAVLAVSSAGRTAPAQVPLASQAPQPPQTDEVYDQSFQCPEALPDDKARRTALVDYFHWASARHPDWSVAQAVEFKKQLLVRHQCATSLRDLADYAKTEH
jgi:hypothetical protein